MNLDIYNDNPFSFHELKIFLRSRNYNDNILFKRIKYMIKNIFEAIKNDICNLDSLKNNTTFQLFGIDIIFDKELRPYVLEFNKGPEMRPKNSRDEVMKTKLNRDMLNIVKLVKTENNLFEQIV